MRCILLVAALICLPGMAVGVAFSVPLSDLVGPIDFLPSIDTTTASFDFGQQFSAIESVSIEIEAQVFARQFDVCGTVFNPQPCVREIQLLGFIAIMEDDDPTPGFVWSDGLSFSDDFRALEGSGTDIASFNNPIIGWDFLLSGKGSLIFGWNTVLGNPDRIIPFVIEPSGEILSRSSPG